MLGARQKAWLKDGLRASRAPFKFVLSSVPLHGPWGVDRWAGYATERDELLEASCGTSAFGGVIVLSADVHAAVDVELGTGVREFIAGPLGAWPLCRIVPQARRLLEASGRFFICDAFNCGALHRPPRGEPARGRAAVHRRTRRRAPPHADPRALSPCRGGAAGS